MKETGSLTNRPLSDPAVTMRRSDTIRLIMERTITSPLVDWANCLAIESIPGKVGGAWVFRGTRVPVSAILNDLKDVGINEVVRDYPSVTHEQIRTVLDFLARSADPILPPARL